MNSPAKASAKASVTTPAKASAKASPKTPALSPCVQVCQIDQMLRLCLGCGRTLDEIGRWSKLDDRQRIMVMQKLPYRIKKLEPQRRAAGLLEEAS